MSESIFRKATREAIKEIIVDNADSVRFGVLLSEDGMEKAANRVVDLFETTLELRSRVRLEQLIGQVSEQQQIESKKTTAKVDFLSETPTLPKTRNAAEIYDRSMGRQAKSVGEDVIPAPTVNFRLPRTRHNLTEQEREKLAR